MLDSVRPPKSHLTYKEAKRSHSRMGIALVMLLLLGVGIFLGSKFVTFAQRILEGSGNRFTFRDFFIAPDRPLEGETAGQVRILLLGIGGGGHEGGTLADTVILATLDLTAKNSPRVGLVSIPRDLVVNIPGYDWRKINSAHAFGELEQSGRGPSLAVQAVEQLTGQVIPYYAVIDFEGFKTIIDDLDGIEITVDQAFTDAFYPDERFGYLPPIRFEAGRQEMDGERALQFVRSRHGDNNQGTDFARSRRQQQVLRAVKDKVKSLRVLTNLTLIQRILENLSNHIRTNLTPHEIKRLYALSRNLKDEDIFSLAVDVDSGLVCNQILEESGAYVLIPCAGLGNYTSIRQYITDQFLSAGFQQEKPSIEIQNATAIPGLGSRVQSFLYFPHVSITTGNLKADAVYQESIIYDNSKGQKPATLDYLKKKLGARLAASPFPFTTQSQAPDFVIVISHDIEPLLP